MLRALWGKLTGKLCQLFDVQIRENRLVGVGEIRIVETTLLEDPGDVRKALPALANELEEVSRESREAVARTLAGLDGDLASHPGLRVRARIIGDRAPVLRVAEGAVGVESTRGQRFRKVTAILSWIRVPFWGSWRSRQQEERF